MTVSWTDAAGDLWRYDPTSGTWTWVAGEVSDVVGADYGERGVAAASNVPGARVAAATWTDTAGHLWMFGGWGVACGTGTGAPLSDLWSATVYDHLRRAGGRRLPTRHP